MARLALLLLLTLFLTPQAWAQYGDSAQMEQQIQQEFQRMQSELQRQGVNIPNINSEYDGGFSGNDWRGDLKRYHGNKQPSVKDDDRPRSGQSCVNRCLSRGGQPDDCNDECGEVHDEGVFYDPGYDPGQLPPSDEEGTGNGGGEFEGVQYDCFRQCRLHGDGFDTCSELCRSR